MSMRRLRVALAQINTTIGDLDGNSALIIDALDRAREAGADIVAFPELTVTGYPPEDLLLRSDFVRDQRAALEMIAVQVTTPAAVIGFVGHDPVGGDAITNSAALISQGEIRHVYDKIVLPNYGVFDEERYFKSGNSCPVFDIAGIKVGINICEDVWTDVGPAEVQCAAGAEVIININSSPYWLGKLETRRKLVSDLAQRNAAYVVYVNQVGGQDELVFDGGSAVFGPDGSVIARAKQFEEELLIVDLDLDAPTTTTSSTPDVEILNEVGSAFPVPGSVGLNELKPDIAPVIAPALSQEAEVYNALVVGTRDYLAKTGFSRVLIALSGGIDSTLTAAVAVDAIGAENVVGIGMPSRYSSEGSVSDAKELADRLGITMWTIPIEPAHRAFEEMVSEQFADTEPNTAEENVQARIRGVTIMSISNKFNWLVLTTGNKSEMATGYATLYGDMAGGFAVLKDVPKTLVYRICDYRNTTVPGSALGNASQSSHPEALEGSLRQHIEGPIPQEVIDKPPSAELRPDQLDEDSLPPYPVLDRIIERYVEQRLSPSQIIAMEDLETGDQADEATVRRMIRLIDINEYKRRQSPPGVKITELAFGRDRRLPIASRYRG
jgi:NAD+ synthase (glutamine-hydrolysing)